MIFLIQIYIASHDLAIHEHTYTTFAALVIYSAQVLSFYPQITVG